MCFIISIQASTSSAVKWCIFSMLNGDVKGRISYPVKCHKKDYSWRIWLVTCWIQNQFHSHTKRTSILSPIWLLWHFSKTNFCLVQFFFGRNYVPKITYHFVYKGKNCLSGNESMISSFSPLKVVIRETLFAMVFCWKITRLTHSWNRFEWPVSMKIPTSDSFPFGALFQMYTRVYASTIFACLQKHAKNG